MVQRTGELECCWFDPCKKQNVSYRHCDLNTRLRSKWKNAQLNIHPRRCVHTTKSLFSQHQGIRWYWSQQSVWGVLKDISIKQARLILCYFLIKVLLILQLKESWSLFERRLQKQTQANLLCMQNADICIHMPKVLANYE